MIWDEKSQVISFDEKCTKSIQTSFFEFAKDQQESDEITKIRELSKILNSYSDRWEISSSDFNTACISLSFLKAEIKEGGHGYEFIPNIPAIRERLKYEKGIE